MKLIKRSPSKVCPCCLKKFFKKTKYSKTQWNNRIWCSKSCKNIKIPIEEYKQQQLIFYISKTITTSIGCMEWQGHLDTCGYGSVHFLGKIKGLHRLIWELVKGIIPEGLQILHHCDNPPCINPNHLFLGTHQDNMADMVLKGRAKKKSIQIKL